MKYKVSSHNALVQIRLYRHTQKRELSLGKLCAIDIDLLKLLSRDIKLIPDYRY